MKPMLLKEVDKREIKYVGKKRNRVQHVSEICLGGKRVKGKKEVVAQEVHRKVMYVNEVNVIKIKGKG